MRWGGYLIVGHWLTGSAEPRAFRTCIFVFLFLARLFWDKKINSSDYHLWSLRLIIVSFFCIFLNKNCYFLCHFKKILLLIFHRPKYFFLEYDSPYHKTLQLLLYLWRKLIWPLTLLMGFSLCSEELVDRYFLFWSLFVSFFSLNVSMLQNLLRLRWNNKFTV